MLNFMLFSRKQTPVISMEDRHALENKKQEDLVRRTAIINWVKTAPLSETSAMFSEFLEEPSKLSYDPSLLEGESKTIYFAIINRINNLARLWAQIDKQRISDEQALTMYNSVILNLPEVMKSYVNSSKRQGYVVAWNHYSGPNTQKALSDISEVLTNIKIDQQSRAIILPNVVKVSNGAVQSFPKFQTNSLMLNTELAHLEELWLQASSKSNSAEDEYILEEIATNYLPEAWKMYSTFRLAKSEYAEKAEAIIIEQVILLKERVQSILDESFEAMLTTLEAQTEFLKVKMEDTQKDTELVKSRVTSF
jgi:DNA-binding TFAR19-related protein (PDSD5 family)